jgi:hypothetical protein
MEKRETNMNERTEAVISFLAADEALHSSTASMRVYLLQWRTSAMRQREPVSNGLK